MQEGYADAEKADLSKKSTRAGKALTESKYAFQLEPYENGAPAPTLLQPEVLVSVAAPFLLTNPDFSKMQVVKAYAHTVVAPAIDYWRTTIDTKKGAEVARFKVARIFNPLHVLGYPISVSDIDSLKILRLTEHPLIMPHIDGMKSEIIKYQALVKYTHTHTGTGVCDWIDYLSIFRVKKEVSVAKIASIILSILRRLHRLSYRFLE